MEINFVNVDLFRIVNEIVEAPAIQKTASDSQISIELEGSPLWVVGDPALLHNAFRNVIKTPWMCNPMEGVVNIEIAQSKTGDACIYIRDHGPGISLKDYESIADVFLPFASTRPVSRRHEFGRSLAFTYRVLAAHGASISARNIPDRGAEFAIVLKGRQSFSKR